MKWVVLVQAETIRWFEVEDVLDDMLARSSVSINRRDRDRAMKRERGLRVAVRSLSGDHAPLRAPKGM